METQEITSESIPKQKPDYRLEQMDNELLLYHLQETRILYCNPTASLIWQLCDGQRNVGELTALLCEAYPEAAQDIPEDVQTSIGELVKAGCLEFL